MTSGLSAGRPLRALPAFSGLVSDDALAQARALLIARLVVVLYLLELVLNFTRPHVLPNEPTLSIFEKLPGSSGSLGRLLATPRAAFWTMLAGIAVGTAIQAYVTITRPAGRRALVLTWTTLAVLLGPFALLSLVIIFNYPVTTLACVPSTAFVLWLLHHGQRFARIPLPMLLAAFGWGALIVFGVGRAYSGPALGTFAGYLAKTSHPGTNMSALLTRQYRVIDLLIVHLSVANVLLIAAGVLLLLLLCRHPVTDVVSGLVLGAAVGLGYNLVESVLFIQLFGSLSAFNGATGGFEYWIRQSIGLLGGQVTFGALLGAGIGIAAGARHSKQRRLIGGAALLSAIGGAVATEILSAWFAHLVNDHITGGGALDTLVISPFFWLLPQAPFIALAVLLLRAGLRARTAAARAAIPGEAVAGGAITGGEAPVLADPALRLWALVGTWRQYGPATALALHRLQTAQLDLAGWRWWRQQAGAANDTAPGDQEERLRAKVMRLKTILGTDLAASK